MTCQRLHSYDIAELGFEPKFSGLKCQPLSTAPPLKTTQLLGDSKPVVTMGTGLMWKAERVDVQAAVGRLQVGSTASSLPLPWSTSSYSIQLSALGSGF